ncbi:HEPN family nuclease [Bradyrhizobium sp.]|uniref:HEPN family nuclease n=1 Tax=Bradyrhizobium sp. TaxID=376 RepID=UPI0027373CCF|nr:HEPN family nuclease [Bradyrhizobium sp.]MDP3074736.1 HEPN family nuclease [Bradyrhizobium sp.]
MKKSHPLVMEPRNDPIGFAKRSQENLRIIEESLADKGEGHVVTQLVQSLLAYLVFPKERGYYTQLNSMQLSTLEQNGWPRPEQIIGTTKDAGDLIRHMRNAVCHGLVVFHGIGPDSSNSRKLEEIFIEFSDRPKPGADINWQVAIEGVDLRRFMFELIHEANNN